MQATAFTLMFLASAPIFLVPAFIAPFSRRDHASKVVPANVFLWAILYFGVRAVVVGDAGSRGLSPFQPSALLVLFAWLGLLRYAIVGGGSHSAADGSNSPIETSTSGFADRASSNKSLERTRDR